MGSLPKYLVTNNKSVLTVWIVIALLGLVLLAIRYSDRTREERLSQLEGMTVGKVITIEENDNLQGENNVVVDSYTIEYEYEVDGQVHYGRDNLEGAQQHKAYIEGIIESGFKLKIDIKYDVDDPSISLIIPPSSMN